MTKYLLETGNVIDAKVECDCLIHGNIPHWLYMDEVWRDRNNLLLDDFSRFKIFERQEQLRIQYRKWYMDQFGIVEILDDKDVI